MLATFMVGKTIAQLGYTFYNKTNTVAIYPLLLVFMYYPCM